MNLFSRLTSTSLIIGSLVLPATTIAATSQQLLDQSLTSMVMRQPNAFTGTLDITETKTPLLRTGSKSSQSAKLSFSYEQSLTSSSSQGFVQLNELLLRDEGSLAPTDLNLTEPIRVTVRSVDGINYVKASPLMPILKMMGLSGAITAEQVAPYERWMKVDLLDGMSEDLPLNFSLSKEQKDLLADNDLKADLLLAAQKRISPIRVISMSQVAGRSGVIRLRARVNPAFVNFIEQQDLKRAGKDITQKKNIQALYKKTRETIKNLNLAFIVDTNDVKHPAITRVEFGMDVVTLEKGCGYARHTRAGVGIESSYNCNLSTHRTKSHVVGAINIVKKDAVVVEIPTDAVSFKDAITQLFGLAFGGGLNGADSTPTVPESDTAVPAL